MWWNRKLKPKVVEAWTPDLLKERDDRLAWLMRDQKRHWKLINGNLLQNNVPVMMAEGTYGALGAYPLPVAAAAVTATTTAANLMTAGQSAMYLPIPANGLLAPQAYRFVIAGLTTLTATASNYTWTMTIGNSATVASNISIGASSAVAKTATAITNAFFQIKGDLTVQSVGITGGSNSKIVGVYVAMLNGGAVGGAYTSWLWGTGATAASFDSTVGPNAGTTGGQFNAAVTASVAATDTFTVQQVHFMDWN